MNSKITYENRFGMIYELKTFDDGSIAEVCKGADLNVTLSGVLIGNINETLNIFVECYDWDGELVKKLDKDFCISFEDGQVVYLTPEDGKAIFQFESPLEGVFKIHAYLPETNCSHDEIEVVISNGE